jgi:hypothetical protein
MYLNRVELIGFLGSGPEANFTPNGKAATSLSLATKTSWMKGDKRQERVEWHKIQVWGKLGEYAAGFKKGAHIPRRRIAVPRVRDRGRHESPHLRDRRQLDPQPAPRPAQ